MNDTELDELMRRADPARNVRDLRSETEIASDLRRITGTPRTRHAPTGPGHRVGLITIPAVAAAAIVMAVAVVIQLWAPHPETASAATPPLLELAPASTTLGAVVDHATAKLDSASNETSQRRSTSEGWYLRTTFEGGGSSRSIITPQIIDTRWNEDLSGAMIVTAGRSYALADLVGTPSSDEAPLPGTVLAHDEFAAGEMPVRHRIAPPTTSRELRLYLAESLALEPTSTDSVAYVQAIRTLLGEWSVNPAVHAALLRILTDTDGITVAGDVNDRLGRPGTALRATSPASPHHDYLVVISRDTGKIIALETIYTGGIANVDVPKNSVVEYIAWK